MSVTCPVRLDAKTTIFVEVEELSGEEEREFAKVPGPTREPSVPLPADAEETTAADRVIDTVHRLQGSLSGVLRVIHNSMQDHAPDEWGVELTIGFKGTTNPIPVFVSGEANAAIKVHAKWKKQSSVKE